MASYRYERDIDPADLAPRAEKQYTRKERWANWWDYNLKWVLLIGIAAAFVAYSFIGQYFFTTKPDYNVAMVAPYYLPDDTVTALQEQLARYGEDLNGDGKTVVTLNVYTLDYSAGDTQTESDAYLTMAGTTKLATDVAGGLSSVFLLYDPAGFQESTGSLRYLDGTLPEAELPAFIVEIPADTKNGDIASNLAMAGARTWRKAPKMIADALLAHLPSIEHSVFAKVEVAGPGFINLFLAPSFWASVVLGACSNKGYGRTDHGKGAKYNVEFVSANPTGPMHMGNARGGALGDCLAAVLDWSGYDVTREFYINDAGNQIQKFGKSLAVRYLQQFCGEETYPLPAECYQGGDIKVLAGEFAEINGDKYVAACSGLDEEALFASEAFETLKNALVDYALPKNIAALKRDLGKYRIDYDVWFHESTLHESGAVLDVVNKLLELGACYKAEDGAIMYRSAQYAAKYGTVNKKKTEDGTEEEAKDEVLVRANGIPTYFAADIAYHYNKLATRGFAKAIDVWGADHHGHVARMKGAMDAIGLNGNDLDVVLMQMVNLMRDGQPVRMSKRTGNAITLTDLLEEVPIDSARFLFNMHDAGSGIDFDLDQAVKTDNDNPVYYVQYAHARICSILKKMESEGVAFAGAEQVDATLLTDPSEMDLIRMLAAFPQEIVMAAEKYDPSRINRFVIDLASAFHRFYGNCRIQGADPAVQQARLALCIGVKNVIFNVLTMFKINVPEKM